MNNTFIKLTGVIILITFVSYAVKIAQEITEEGRHAIESPTSPVLSNLGPEGYMLGELWKYSFLTYC